MDKKTIIAFALSFLVLILWSFFFGSKSEPPKEPQKKEQIVQEKTAPAREAAPAPQKSAEAVTIPQATQEKEEEVTVETPLYRAVFSNVGPALKSFRLKKYRVTADPESPIVELAHGKVDLLNVHFEPIQKTGEAALAFKPSETTVLLDAHSSPRELIFTATSPEE
jgi:YidC/Oxa1 family membrane protein insertase